MNDQNEPSPSAFAALRRLLDDNDLDDATVLRAIREHLVRGDLSDEHIRDVMALAQVERWGPGRGAADAKPFGHATVGRERVALFHGEHPHSRNYNNTYAREPDGTVYAFDGHRVQTVIELRTDNYLKTSHLSGDEIRRSCRATIALGCVRPEVVYEVTGRDPERVLLEVVQTIPKLMEHPVILWDELERVKLTGRPVFYERTPAVVERPIWDQGCVVLRAEEGVFPSPVWREDDDEPYGETIKVDLLDNRIWWFRPSKVVGVVDV